MVCGYYVVWVSMFHYISGEKNHVCPASGSSWKVFWCTTWDCLASWQRSKAENLQGATYVCPNYDHVQDFRKHAKANYPAVEVNPEPIYFRYSIASSPSKTGLVSEQNNPCLVSWSPKKYLSCFKTHGTALYTFQPVSNLQSQARNLPCLKA